MPSEAFTDRGSKTLKVWLDLVCPFCMLSKAPMLDAIEGLDVDVEYMPFELRPYPTPTLRPEDDYLPRIWSRSVYPMAERLGVEIRLPTISPQPYSALAFEGYHFAKSAGSGPAYVDAVLAAFFRSDLDIGNADVLEQVAADVGLPRDRFRAALDGRLHRPAHEEALGIARDRRVDVVPTFALRSFRYEGVPNSEAMREEIRAELDRGS